MPGFTHLHTVSGFSLRYGASHPERLAERAAERGMDALALTDRDTLAGAVRFAKACDRAGVRPLFGVGLAVEGESAERTPEGGRAHRLRTPVRGGAFVDESAPRVTFLARDGARGWAELCRLVTAAHAVTGDPQTGAGQPWSTGPRCPPKGSPCCSARPPRSAGRWPPDAPTGPPCCSRPGGRSTATTCASRPSITGVKAPAPGRCGLPPVPSASLPNKGYGPC